jgi:endogenous inhibitor of DNA gyrase (YacG/DUF329 family)
MTDRPDNVVPLRPRSSPPCPICGKPAATDFRPFCSKRCADLDLHKWLNEVYVVPSAEPPDGLDGDDIG